MGVYFILYSIPEITQSLKSLIIYCVWVYSEKLLLGHIDWDLSKVMKPTGNLKKGFMWYF